jgi:DNA recombination protein RmuC
MAMELGIGLGLGGALGSLLVWLFMRSGGAAIRARLEDRESALVGANARLAELAEEAAELREKLAREETARQQEAAAAAERLDSTRKNQEQLLEQFAATSRIALDSNSKSFLNLAKTHVQQMLTEVESREAKQKLEMDKVVDPLKVSLKDVREHLGALEKERVKAYTDLTAQVKGLSEAQMLIHKEAANLVTALRVPTVRGRWGEFHLRRVVELAGLVEHCDFNEQHSVQTDGGKIRPDLIINLAGGRTIVVDAKTPLDAYLNAVEVDDPVLKRTILKKHVKQVRDHVRQLASKSYHDQFALAPDMVILFLPAESILYEASHADPTLLEYGIENRVLIATPMTLIALLHGVATGWRQDSIAKNAQKISKLGQDLYERICKYTEHFAKVGSKLNSAVSSYNQAVGSLESRVLVSARRFKDLGSSSTQELPEIEHVDKSVREVRDEEYREPGDRRATLNSLHE